MSRHVDILILVGRLLGKSVGAACVNVGFAAARIVDSTVDRSLMQIMLLSNDRRGYFKEYQQKQETRIRTCTGT
jgi:hypothetical protein